ncbi:hypothetical protein ACAG96_01070 [Candidatus Izemoplasma sp. B36]|uniref:hypothetical protein n=1 Tax=Candidatus Izemoplasma sp. B36 TaxID=3242468 RepID=UPI0035571FBD
MKAIIVHSTSKFQRSLNIAKTIDGDIYRIEHVKKPIKSMFFQMIVYGFQTVAKKSVLIKPIQIDFDKYDEVYLISPVWAGHINAYMRQFLKEHLIKNKKIHIIGTCLGDNIKYFDDFKLYLDESNEIVEESLYVKGEKQ